MTRPTLEPTVPHSLLSESALCAAILLDHEAAEFDLIRTTINPEDFMDDAFRWIYEACIASLRAWADVTIPTVAYELQHIGRLDEVGAEVQLIDICSRWFTSIGALAHARVIADCAARRRRITAGIALAQDAYLGTPSKDYSGEMPR